jgi:transposase-like protein
VVAWLHESHHVVVNQRSEAMKRTRWDHGATFKAQIALAAIKGDKTLTELVEQFSIHPTQIIEWKQPLLVRAADVSGGGREGSLLQHRWEDRRQVNPLGISIAIVFKGKRRAP